MSPEGLPEGGMNFRGETNRHISLLQGFYLFITSNILHSAIIIWSSSYLTTDIPSDESYSVRLYLISQWRMKSSRDIIQLSRAVDITMRHNIQQLT